MSNQCRGCHQSKGVMPAASPSPCRIIHPPVCACKLRQHPPPIHPSIVHKPSVNDLQLFLTNDIWLYDSGFDRGAGILCDDRRHFLQRPQLPRVCATTQRVATTCHSLQNAYCHTCDVLCAAMERLTLPRACVPVRVPPRASGAGFLSSCKSAKHLSASARVHRCTLMTSPSAPLPPRLPLRRSRQPER